MAVTPTHRRKSIALAFREWRKYPTRCGYCIAQDGSPVWLRHYENPLPTDVFLDCYEENGTGWTPMKVAALLDRRREMYGEVVE